MPYELEKNLLRDAMAAEIEVTDTKISPLVGPAECGVTIEARLKEGEEEAEWAAIPLLYALACLSFNDGRPRGYSANEFHKDDWLTIDDFLAGLRYVAGELHWHGDYISGRRLKTSLTMKPNGSFKIETFERGESATRWIDLLKGKQSVQLVGVQQPEEP